jgi:hypothetical protein
MGIIMIGPSLIPLPEGIDPTNMDSLKENFHLFQPKNFIPPFLAHALGTLAGAFATSKIAANNNLKLALVIGAFFLVGGIMMVNALPAPIWFDVLDLVVAYIPMAWLGHKLAS